MLGTIHLGVCIVLLFCAFWVCFSVSAIESAIFLILTFVFAAITLLCFHIDFLGWILIIIYVGAIAVLFLFVIMMLNVKYDEIREIYGDFYGYDRVILLVLATWTGVAWCWFYTVFGSYFEDMSIPLYARIDDIVGISEMGQVLFNYYLIAFLLAGLVLLVALIGAIVITIEYTNNESKQVIHRQLSRKDNNLSFFKSKAIK